MGAPGRPFPLTATGAVGLAGRRQTLFAIVVNKAVASGTIAVYNGASAAGTLIGTLAMDTVGDFNYGNSGAFFDAGIWIVLTGASPDITVVAG